MNKVHNYATIARAALILIFFLFSFNTDFSVETSDNCMGWWTRTLNIDTLSKANGDRINLQFLLLLNMLVLYNVLKCIFSA